ncbi:hypothetical protein KIPB_011739, partial [Kipferlia bialata]
QERDEVYGSEVAAAATALQAAEAHSLQTITDLTKETMALTHETEETEQMGRDQREEASRRRAQAEADLRMISARRRANIEVTSRLKREVKTATSANDHLEHRLSRALESHASKHAAAEFDRDAMARERDSVKRTLNQMKERMALVLEIEERGPVSSRTRPRPISTSARGSARGS